MLSVRFGSSTSDMMAAAALNLTVSDGKLLLPILVGLTAPDGPDGSRRYFRQIIRLCQTESQTDYQTKSDS